MGDVVVVGSANADLVARVERFPAPGETTPGLDFQVIPGGKGANQAVAAGRLGASCRFVGCIGNDANGEMLLDSLRSAAVDTASCIRATEATGVAMIWVDPSGQNEIVVIPGANAYLRPEHVPPIQKTDVALFQFETPLDTVAAGLRSCEGCSILNPAPAREVPSDFPWERVAIITPNETEAEALTGKSEPLQSARSLLARGVGQVVVTLGKEGCLRVGPDAVQHIPAFEVRPVDTTAAGDAFNGSLATFLAEGFDIEEALRMACAAASLSTTRPGAQPAMPTRTDLELFLRDQPKR